MDDVTGVPFFFLNYEAAILISHLLSVVDADELQIRVAKVRVKLPCLGLCINNVTFAFTAPLTTFVFIYHDEKYEIKAHVIFSLQAFRVQRTCSAISAAASGGRRTFLCTYMHPGHKGCTCADWKMLSWLPYYARDECTVLYVKE